jgi:hypothetical protein
LKVDDAYLGLAWVRLLPALLGRQESTATGFTIYDAETRALITHAVRGLGEKACPERAESPTYGYETSEGMLEAPSRLWTDKHGHLLRLEAGNLVVRLSDRAAIEGSFGERRSAAQKRMAAGGVQPPAKPGR